VKEGHGCLFEPTGPAGLAADGRSSGRAPGSRTLGGVSEESQTQRPDGAGTGFERGTDGPKVIVAGMDGSAAAARATAYAAGLARRQNALLAIVYVQPVYAGAAAMGASVNDTTEEVADELVREIRAAAERLRGIFEVRWEFHTLRGDPFIGLVQTADRLKADAVVVGASEQAGHRIIGSVAVRLVKAGRWPVTVVP
jgi:nucleotide-binding universal stress UspA family protein